MINKKIRHKILSAICMGALITMPLSAAENLSRYIVKFNPGSASTGKQLLKNHGAKIKLELSRLNAVAVELPEQALSALNNNPNIKYIEKDSKGKLQGQTPSWSASMVQADLLNDGLASNVKVCVIDTGIDINHEDIYSGLITGSAGPDSGNWWEAAGHHGTFVSGSIIAANNDVGTVGILPNGNVALHMHKMTEDTATTSELAYGIENCQNVGANVINISWTFSKSRTLLDAVALATADKILIVSASGNNGDSGIWYPCGYDQVLCVGAVKSNKEIWTNSVHHEKVELVAPGVSIYGLVPTNFNHAATLTIDTVNTNVAGIYNSPIADVTGNPVDCGNGRKACNNVNNKICLLNPSKIDVTDAVLNCQSGGATGVLVHNDALISQYFEMDNTSVTVPVAAISDDTGLALEQATNAVINLSVKGTHYGYASGTSFSSPIVAGSAALAWSYHPECSNQEIRQALTQSAQDLGDAGWDEYYGFGLVQVKAAKEYLDANPCNGDVTPPTTVFSLSISNHKSKGKSYTDLTWSGAVSTDVDIYRDANLIITKANDGTFSEQISRGSYSYQICEAGTSSCTDTIRVSL